MRRVASRRQRTSLSCSGQQGACVEYTTLGWIGFKARVAGLGCGQPGPERRRRPCPLIKRAPEARGGYGSGIGGELAAAHNVTGGAEDVGDGRRPHNRFGTVARVQSPPSRGACTPSPINARAAAAQLRAIQA